MSTQELIRDFILEDLLLGQHDGDLDEETNLLLTGLVDSLGVMRMMMFIDDELDVQVPPADITIDNFRTIGTIANYLARQKA